MTDFFTKKQKKFWCETCRIFIEYNKKVIDYHNQSKNHLNNLNRPGRYQSEKAKFNKYVQGLKTNTKEKLLENKRCRQDIEESRDYFQEIMKEKMAGDVSGVKTRKWGVFWDERYKRVYYYNYLTQQSVWERPKDFDGEGEDEELERRMKEAEKAEEEDEEKDGEEYEPKEEEKEGNVGKWEVVEKGKSVFGNRKASEEESEEKKNEKGRETKPLNTSVKFEGISFRKK